MPEAPKPEVGSVGWVDLTVPDAAQVRDFYQAVAGWKVHEVGMSDAGEKYADYAMLTGGSGKGVTGICWRRGTNQDIPAGWMIYITVENLEASIAKCLELGGKVVLGPRNFGPDAKYVFIQDPSGACCGLFQAG